ISAHHPDLLAAQKALETAQLRYTDDHPKIQELRQTLAAIESRIANQKAGVDPGVALSGSSLTQTLYAKLLELRNQQAALKSRETDLRSALANVSKEISTLPEQQRKLAGL